MKAKNTICLWFDKDSLNAARFYAATFPGSKVAAVHNAPADYPSSKKDDVVTAEFTVVGFPFAASTADLRSSIFRVATRSLLSYQAAMCVD
jgi:predicted 3-demethylubiquinone-9 3-methyltransferase (glyoxalase superfamily)